ncbi:MAG: FG-GAP-like repeat-containing protein [Deltaproteobacteria bacterium]|nr:FG-GAP-like repeat-containing protein [Deltaproteobacteria bacterium]
MLARPTAWFTALLIPFALSTAACTRPTELWIEIETNIPVATSAESGDALLSVRVQASVEGGARFWDAPYELVRGNLAFPGFLRVFPPSADETRPLRVRVIGILASGKEVRQDALVSFGRGRRLLVRMFLAGECLNGRQLVCEDQGLTCSESGACIPIPRPDLPEFLGETSPRDAVIAQPGDVAGIDASIPDAAPFDAPVFDAPDGACIHATERMVLTPTVTPAGAARPLAPLSMSRLSGARPALRWVAAAGATSHEVVLCRDHAMSLGCQTLPAPGTTLTPASDLAVGLWYWRVRALPSRAESLVWAFVAGRSSTTHLLDARLDFDADGREDLAVGGSDTNGTISGSGSLRVIYGGFVPTSTPAATLISQGRCGNELLARQIANAQDINGDGYSDVVVGAGSIGSPGLPAAIRVFLGGPTRFSAITEASQVFADADTTRRFGASLAGIGDVNGDGYGDVAVGCPGLATSPTVAGSVLVFFGSPAGLVRAPAMVLSMGTPAAYFGLTVASAGDSDGDGFSDLLVAAPDEGNGVVRLFRGGSAGLSSTVTQSFTGLTARWRFGLAVRGAFDANGDGWPDLAIGAPSTQGAGAINGAGEAMVYLNRAGAAGDTFGPMVQRYTRVATEPYGWGKSLVAGDFNGDGFDDLVVGAAGTGNASFGRTEGTAVAGFRGSATGLETTRAWWIPGVQGAALGNSMSARDLNADGFVDLLLSTADNFNTTGYVAMHFSDAMGIPMVRTTRYASRPIGSGFPDGFGAPIALQFRRPFLNRVREASASRPWCPLGPT